MTQLDNTEDCPTCEGGRLVSTFIKNDPMRVGCLVCGDKGKICKTCKGLGFFPNGITGEHRDCMMCRGIHWDLPVGCVLMPYETFCEMRGETSDPELLGSMVRVQGGGAHLVETEEP